MAADFDEPVFDDDFIRGATFTEPSARERLRPPSRRERRRTRRAAKRARRAGRAPLLRRRRRGGEPSHRKAVIQLIGVIAVLFAISFALWWWNKPPAQPDPGYRIVPTVPEEAPPPQPEAPAPAPSTELPSSIPQV